MIFINVTLVHIISILTIKYQLNQQQKKKPLLPN